LPTNDLDLTPTAASIAEPALHPQPLLLGVLALVMLATLWIGLAHALDDEEDASVRWTSGVLAALSLGALIATVHAGIA